jgi:hypothetical protein
MPSTSVACSVRAAAILIALVGAGCGSEPQVTIAITRSDALDVAPDFLRFSFPVKGGDTIEAGVFNVDAIPDEAFAAIPPGTSFSVDLAGCLSLDPAACQEPTEFVARGCAGPFSRRREDQLAIAVELLPTSEGNARCPVAP